MRAVGAPDATSRRGRCETASVDIADFWRLVDDARAAGSCESQAQDLQSALRTRGLDETIGFSRLFDEALDALYTWDLWAVAYIVQGGCSDNGFEYFRAWVISQGQSAFDLALSDPAAFGMAIDPQSNDEDRECEDLLYAAQTVHKELTGEYGPTRTSGHPSGPQGEPWEEGDLERTGGWSGRGPRPV